MTTIEQLSTLKTAIELLLVEEGFRPVRNDNDDIEFKVEGKHFYFDFDSNDPAYVRLMCPHFWHIDDAQELRAAYVAANQACERCKGVKVFVEGEESV
jgi:hypothetical protein